MSITINMYIISFLQNQAVIVQIIHVIPILLKVIKLRKFLFAKLYLGGVFLRNHIGFIRSYVRTYVAERLVETKVQIKSTFNIVHFCHH